MRLRRRSWILLPLLLSSLVSAADIEQRIDSLLSRMTLEEKLGQMSQATMDRMNDTFRTQARQGRWGSVINVATAADRAELQRIALKESRLRIPIIFGRDVIHGYRTMFPIPFGQSASWDPELIREAARVAAKETAASGIHWTFAPMLDITRDPRWGRIAETLGEDPYLTSTLGAAMVRGFQGDALDAPGSIAACAKHYVGYGAAEGGRDYNSTWIPEGQLRDVFLPSFEAAKKAGVATFMSSFNDLNGVPVTGNPFALKQVLRKEWKFDGFVVSDWDSVIEMVPHGFAADRKEAAMKGVNAGVDMEMVSDSYFQHGKALLAEGKIDQKTIDEAVRNILRVKFRLGLFDKPAEAAEIGAPAPESLAVAKKLAAESYVLLKNAGALPLAKGKIAVTGPLANAPVDQMGCWTSDGRPQDVQTPLAALRQALGEANVLYAPGLKTSRDTSHEGFAAAVAAAKGAQAVVVFLGEEQILSGEAHSRAYLNLPGAQEALVAELAKTGKPVIAVILAGRPLTFQNVTAKAAAVFFAGHPGTMGGPAIADLLFGVATPSGRLSATFPRTVGQIPLYYAHLNTGRPAQPMHRGVPSGTPLDPQGYVSNYLDEDYTPEYPFGFGLSYTSFAYSNMRVSSPAMPLDGKITVSADVANTGKFDADEVVQLYVRDLVGSVSRPIRELKGFRRVHLKAGEKKTVEFTLASSDLAFHNDKMQLVTEPGAFHVWIAPDSARGERAEFRVTE